MHSSSRRTGSPSIWRPSTIFTAVLESFNAALVLLLAREAGDYVAGEHDDGRDGEGFHGLEGAGEVGKKGLAEGWVGEGSNHAGGGVETDAEALAGGVGGGKVGVGPVAVLVDQLDLVVAGLGYFGQALREGEIAEDGPEHDGEREGRGLGRRGLGWGWVRGCDGGYGGGG